MLYMVEKKSFHNVLERAKDKKDDEFYTSYEIVENELNHYNQFFENKIIYNNCDDFYHSNFSKYFIKHFNDFKLKRLYVSGYSIKDKRGYCAEISSVKNDYDDILELDGNELKSCDGDFRSQENLKRLLNSDIVITNPPFSLARVYMDYMIEYGKKFILILPLTIIKSKHVPDMFIDDKISFGYNFRLGKGFSYKGNPVHIYATWFTNLKIKRHAEPLVLTKKYNSMDYKRFDKFPDIINVNKLSDIPYDYDGKMAVPITFFAYDDKKQFKVLGIINGYAANKYRFGFGDHLTVQGKGVFTRVVIQKRSDLLWQRVIRNILE